MVAENLAIQDLQRLGMKQYATLSREEQYEQALQKYAYLADTEKNLGLTDSFDKKYLAESVTMLFTLPQWLQHKLCL